MLMRSRKDGVTVHIRTTRIDHPVTSFSYISNAAIKFDDDDNLFEVSEDGSLFVNGNDASENTVSSFARYKLVRTIKGSKNNILAYMLDLGHGKSIEIRCNKKTGMLFVSIIGAFYDSEGLLGNAWTKAFYSRDSSMDLSGEWNSLAEEWQVRNDEPMLFREARHPQFPVGCLYEASTSTQDGSSSNVRHGRRRRLLDTIKISEDAAKKACANAASGTLMEYCIADVMVTGEVDIADDEFYQHA